MTTTGFLVANLPAGDDLDAALHLVRIGVKFSQHSGRAPDAFTSYLVNLVRDLKTPTFEALLEAFDLACTQTDPASRITIERVDRIWHVVKYHDARRGVFEIGFPALRNKLTAAKKLRSTGSGNR